MKRFKIISKNIFCFILLLQCTIVHAQKINNLVKNNETITLQSGYSLNDIYFSLENTKILNLDSVKVVFYISYDNLIDSLESFDDLFKINVTDLIINNNILNMYIIDSNNKNYKKILYNGALNLKIWYYKNEIKEYIYNSTIIFK